MLTDVLRRYQHYDPATGRFDSKRSLRQYAALLGVNHATLSELYSLPGREPSTMVLQALSRIFPSAADEIAKALKSQPIEAGVA